MGGKVEAMKKADIMITIVILCIAALIVSAPFGIEAEDCNSLEHG